MIPIRLLVVLLALHVGMPSVAEELLSPSHRVELLELYTSEGCSSCPPADQWFSELVDSPALWCEIVPVAFHVDYWDYIGWRDRFARPAFSHRQRRHASEGAVASVYTPGLVLGGTEWRGWFRDRRLPAVRKEPSPVSLRLAYADGEGSLRVRGDAARYVGWLAWLGFEQSTEVRRGENRGKTLKHDFVVLQLEEIALERSEGELAGRFRAPADLQRSGRYALAAWISRPGSPLPLQSVGGWLGPTGALVARKACEAE